MPQKVKHKVDEPLIHFTRLGVYGHSMGGKLTVISAPSQSWMTLPFVSQCLVRKSPKSGGRTPMRLRSRIGAGRERPRRKGVGVCRRIWDLIVLDRQAQ